MYFAGMKTLQVRNLPDKTHAVLRPRGRSGGQLTFDAAASHLRAERDAR